MKKNETMPGVCCLLKNKGPQSITLGIARERGVRGGGSEKRRKEEMPVEDRQEEKNIVIVTILKIREHIANGGGMVARRHTPTPPITPF